MPEGGIARLKQGWLIKQGGRVKNWKRRFFVLDGSRRLTYYVSEADARAGANPLGIIDLQTALFVKPRSQGSGSSTTITWPAQVSSDYCFMIITNDRNYGMYSDVGPEDCRGWVSALQAVRGNVDTNEIQVEGPSDGTGESDHADHPAMARPRANTIASLAAYRALPERYNVPPELPAKVVVMYARWHRILEKTLQNLADHFSVKSYKFECDMSDLYERSPKAMRNRLGELIFADYIDELRYNLLDMIANEPMGKQAFVEATSKQVVCFQFGSLGGEEMVHASPVDGCIQVVVPPQHFGKGIHLTGKRFLDEMTVSTDDIICGGTLRGLPLVDGLNISKARSACQAALSRIGKMFTSAPPTFRCNYLTVHAQTKSYRPTSHHLGDVIVRNLLTELAGAIHAQFPRMKLASFADSISTSRIVFDLADDIEARETATVSHKGELVISAGLKKLHELAVYERRAQFNLAALVKRCAEESSM